MRLLKRKTVKPHVHIPSEPLAVALLRDHGQKVGYSRFLWLCGICNQQIDDATGQVADE